MLSSRMVLRSFVVLLSLAVVLPCVRASRAAVFSPDGQTMVTGSRRAFTKARSAHSGVQDGPRSSRAKREGRIPPSPQPEALHAR